MNGHIRFSFFFFIKHSAFHMNKLCSGPSTQGTSHIFISKHHLGKAQCRNHRDILQRKTVCTGKTMALMWSMQTIHEWANQAYKILNLWSMIACPFCSYNPPLDFEYFMTYAVCLLYIMSISKCHREFGGIKQPF